MSESASVPTSPTPAGIPVAVALGSNLGDRLRHLARAVRGLEEGGVDITGLSPVFESDPVGYAEQGPFLNAVIVGRTGLSPDDLLALAQALEAEAGRRRTVPGGPRTVDLDVILYGDAQIVRRGLHVPHPRFRERAFVLAPLAEVAPDRVDPETGRTVLDLWRERRDELPPVRLFASPESLRGSAS